jgi:PGF-pre-PGF domain-containing protein
MLKERKKVKKLVLTGVFALLLSVVPLLSVAANTYNGAVFQPNEDGTYTITTPSGNKITLDKVGRGKLSFVFKNALSDAIISVKAVSQRPAAASSDAPGSLYQYFEVVLGEGVSNDDVDTSVWTFEVDKSWLSQNGKTSANVFLHHYNGSVWERLNTRQVAESDTTYTFEADVTSFSPFAVTAVDGLSNTGSPYMTGFIIAISSLAVVGGTFALSRKRHHA